MHCVFGYEQQGSQSRQQGGCAENPVRLPENMGYRPNSVARTLRTSKSNTLGFVTDEIATTPYASKVLEGAQDAASKLGYILLTTNTNNDAELENQEISALLRYNVDGFLYAMMFHRKVDIPEVLEGSPTVVVDSEDAAGRVPSVYPDDELAGYDATNRLIQAGCRRIVYYGSATSIVAQEQRLTGYRRALAEAGIPFDDALVVEVSEFTTRTMKRRGCSTKSSRTASFVSTMCAPLSSTKPHANAECASALTCR